MPDWLQIVSVCLTLLFGAITIILAIYVIIAKNRDTSEQDKIDLEKRLVRFELVCEDFDKLQAEKRLTKLETTSDTMDGIMAEILLRSVNPKKKPNV